MKNKPPKTPKPKKTAAVVSKWERLIAIGCTHGHLANEQCLSEVLRVCESWKPSTRIHLGDFIDLAALRSGAAGTNDEGASITQDLEAGFGFLKEFRPTVLFMGNHEARLWAFLESPNALKQHAAECILRDLREKITKPLGTRFVEHYSIADPRSWLDIGNARFMHGFMFNEQATRDHAETFAPTRGAVVHAHTHRPASATGRRWDSPSGYCVGTLSDRPAMAYAGTRRTTLSWGHACVIGETNHRETRIWLIDSGTGDLRLPV